MQSLYNIATPPASTLVGSPVQPFGRGLKVVNPLEVEEWDRLLSERADGTIFHGSAWARVLREVFDFTPCYLTDIRGGHMDALLPIMEALEAATRLHPRSGRRRAKRPSGEKAVRTTDAPWPTAYTPRLGD